MSTPGTVTIFLNLDSHETAVAVRLGELLQQDNWIGLEECLRAEGIKSLAAYHSSHYGNLTHVAISMSCSVGVLDALLRRHRVDPNARMADGSTALHLASRLGRVPLVECLLEWDPCDASLVDAQGRTAASVAKNRQVLAALEYARSRQVTRLTQLMHSLVGRDDEAGLRELFASERNAHLLNINAVDQTGETVLHKAAKRGSLALVKCCLELGGDAYVKDRKGRMAIEQAPSGKHGDAIRALLREAPMVHSTAIPSGEGRLEGWLNKWTNYAEGYKKRWFVLEGGLISYYKSRSDYPINCRGSIDVRWAKLITHQSDRLRFELVPAGDASGKFHLRSDTFADAKQWIIALEQVKQGVNQVSEEIEATKLGEVGLDEMDSDENLRIGNSQDHLDLLRKAMECLAMMNASPDDLQTLRSCLLACEEREVWWQNRLEEELGQRRLLEESLAQVATENTRMLSYRRKQQKQRQLEGQVVDEEPELEVEEEEEEEFFDAVEEAAAPGEVSFVAKDLIGYPKETRVKLIGDATTIPPISLWSILKNAIGKDLTRIPVPVNYSEPLSMLQRMAEDLEYADLLDQAASEADAVKRILLVTAFAISSYASTDGRVTKPFNPLLGETFEWVHAQRGYRFLAEQVSHHPPISAYWCEASRWRLSSEARVKSKFWGKSMELVPAGLNRFSLDSESYEWRKVTTSVNNIVYGKLWLDHYGCMRVVCPQTGLTCTVDFKQTGWRTVEPKRVEGCVTDAQGQELARLHGHWNRSLQAVHAGQEYELWRRHALPPSSASSYYHFTQLALQLNHLTDDLKNRVCPTDSRLRPDQRAMEEGRWEEANRLKQALEEKQRETRKLLEAQGQTIQPRWFRSSGTGDDDEGEGGGGEGWEYLGGYWEARERGEWSQVRSIFI